MEAGGEEQFKIMKVLAVMKVPKFKRSVSTQSLLSSPNVKPEKEEVFEEIDAMEKSLMYLRSLNVEFEVHINWERQVDREILLGKIFE